jgi:hypothetical protein
MRRTARAGFALLAFVTLATPIPAPPAPGPGQPVAARLFARQVALNEDHPGERRLGPLTYLGGWELSSDDRRFGSISAMQVEGGWVTAAGDRGTIFRFPIPAHDQELVSVIPLTAGPGRFASNVERDSESMQIAGGHAWLAYENNNEIWRHRLADWRADAHAAPAAMHSWPANRGAEAMARLPDGRFLVIAEDVAEDQWISKALMFAGDPALALTRAVPFRVRTPEGQRITDAATLPDGRMLLLARGFTISGGWSAKLLVALLPERAGQLVEPTEVAALAAPLTVDNMEALSVTQEQGRTIVWIASDDNLIPLQRTLLMKFEWAG